MKCRLTWKLKATKSSRFYYQLVPSTLRTEGTEFGLLPTPTAMDCTNATASMKSTQVKEGSMHSVTLTRAMIIGMLPTPSARDYKGRTNPGVKKEISGTTYGETLPDSVLRITGNPSQLNPRFVAEMMGFQPDWTESPFLNGEQKA